MSARVVPIEQVRPLPDSSSPYLVRKMKETLARQGQIEPLQVRKLGHESYTIWHADPWGNEIIFAARELGWNNLLIVEVPRYDHE